jgi:hypothetical protein
MAIVMHTRTEQLFGVDWCQRHGAMGKNRSECIVRQENMGSWVLQSLELRMTMLVTASSDFTDTKTSQSIKQQM